VVCVTSLLLWGPDGAGARHHRRVFSTSLCTEGDVKDHDSLVELGVDKNTTVVFPAPLMSTIGELGSFLARENAAATAGPLTPVAALTPAVLPVQPAAANGKPLTAAKWSDHTRPGTT
jgi:hypothetical protein